MAVELLKIASECPEPYMSFSTTFLFKIFSKYLYQNLSLAGAIFIYPKVFWTTFLKIVYYKISFLSQDIYEAISLETL